MHYFKLQVTYVRIVLIKFFIKFSFITIRNKKKKKGEILFIYVMIHLQFINK